MLTRGCNGPWLSPASVQVTPSCVGVTRVPDRLVVLDSLSPSGARRTRGEYHFCHDLCGFHSETLGDDVYGLTPSRLRDEAPWRLVPWLARRTLARACA